MAIGLPASYSENVIVDKRVLDVRSTLIDTCLRLGWRIYIDQLGCIRAATKRTWTSNGEDVNIDYSVHPFVHIKSVCSMPIQLVDWGRNRKNVTRFLKVFEELSASQQPSRIPPQAVVSDSTNR